MKHFKTNFRRIILLAMTIIGIVACKDDDAGPVTIAFDDLTQFSIDENSSGGIDIGNIITTVENSDITPVFAIVSQTPAGAISISGSSITIADPTVFDYETNTEITGEISATINDIVEVAPFKIAINDVDDSPKLIINDLTQFDIDENNALNTVIGSITFTTEFTTETPTFTIESQSVANAISIDGADIVIADEAAFDFETNTEITGQITGTITGVTETVDFTITINDVDDMIRVSFDTDFSALSIDENSANGTVITAIDTTIENSDETPVFAIESQSVANAVGINGSNLVVNDVNAFDFETNTQITGDIKVTVEGVTETVDFTITINDTDQVATLTTIAVTDITSTTAKTGGVITADGGAVLTERGIVYATTQNPTVDDTKIISTETTDTFAIDITGLNPTTTYYTRAFASNSEGTAYGDEITFTTDVAGAAFYLDSNGVTIKAFGWVPVGHSEMFNGVTYTLVDLATLKTMISSNDDLTTVVTSRITNMEQLFYFLTNFNQDISNWDVSNVTNMSNMLGYTDNFNQDISNWDVSNVTDMFGMFRHAKSFNQNIGDWDVSNVTNMRFLFTSATSFNQDISNWNVSNTTNMEGLFAGATSFNQDIGNWNVSNVTNMASMFDGATSFNQDISNWDVSNVTTMLGMFREIAYNQDISNWDVSNVTNMSYMFFNNSANQDIGNWDVSNVTDMSYMFYEAFAFNQDIGGWDVSKVTNMSNMFKDARAFNQDIGDWDVANVTNMSRLFYYAEVFNQDIGDWDVANVTNMREMFNIAEEFNQDIGDWDVANVTNMEGMFQTAINFNQDISNWDVSNATNMYGMFWGSSIFNQDLSNWSVGNVTSCRRFSLNANNWTLPEPTFTSCSALNN